MSEKTATNTDDPGQIMLINMGGRGNIGDRAMSLNVIRQLRDKAPVARILVGSHTLDFMLDEFKLQPYSYLSQCLGRWGVLPHSHSIFLYPFKILYYILDIFFILTLILSQKYLKITNTWHFMEADLSRSICESDVIYYCGGGYINDVGIFDSRSNLIMAFLAILAKKPVIMSGQGIGPFNTFFSRLLIKLVIPRLSMITFRDFDGSKNFLIENGIRFNGDSVGDDAMSMPQKNTSFSNEWQGKRLGINFRISPFTPDLDKKTNDFSKFLTLIEKETNWQINFFIFETWRPWEKEVLHSLLKESEIKNYIIHETEDPREALYLTSKCDLTLGISYHFIVFSLQLGIPTIAIYTGEYYRSKMEGLLEWYNKKDWCISIQEMTPNCLFNKCKLLIETNASEKNILKQKTELMSEDCSKSIKYALSFLK